MRAQELGTAAPAPRMPFARRPARAHNLRLLSILSAYECFDDIREAILTVLKLQVSSGVSGSSIRSLDWGLLCHSPFYLTILCVCVSIRKDSDRPCVPFVIHTPNKHINMSRREAQPTVASLGALLAGAAVAAAASAVAAGASAALSRCASTGTTKHAAVSKSSQTYQMHSHAAVQSRDNLYSVLTHLVVLARRLLKPRLSTQAWQTLLDEEGRIVDARRLFSLAQQVFAGGATSGRSHAA